MSASISVRPSPLFSQRNFLRVLLLAAVYALSGCMGLAIPYVGSNITLIWLPTGIAVAALLRWGMSCWPGIALGALAVNLWVGSDFGTAGGIALGNTMAPMASAWLLTHWKFHIEFDRNRDIMLFVAAAILGMLVSSSFGVLILLAAGAMPPVVLKAAWLTWWLGDVVGVLLAGPLLLSISVAHLRAMVERRGEFILWAVLSTSTVWIVFFANTGHGRMGLPLAFVPMPLLVWAALRLGVTGASLAVLVMSVLAALATAIGTGPFHGDSPQQGLLLLWAYTVSLAMVAMMITALDAERRTALKRYKEKALHLRTIVDSEPECVKTVAADGTLLDMNRAGLEMIGADSAQQVVGRDISQVVLPAYRAAFNKLIDDAFEGETGSLTFEICGLKGVHRWLETRTVPLHDPDGLVTAALAVTRDITQRKQDEEEIHRLAYYDPLTGLPNRRLLLDRIGLALAHARRTGEHGALMILDLDHFKTLNDTQGHDVGDKLLQAVAGRLSSGIRACDTVARLGGDEFVILIEQLSPDPKLAYDQIATIAEKIRLALNQQFPLEGLEYETTPSTGVCLFLGQSERAEDLLKRADLAMYQAKGMGRNAICFFDPSMQERMEARAHLESRLRHAVEHGELELHYQAQFDRQFTLVGAEALVRWNKPGKGTIAPDHFIPFAEETGLILLIGRWVLESACRQIVAWGKDPKFAQMRVAVNVSARQFRHPTFVDDVREILAASGCNPCHLKLEMTESVAIDDLEGVVERMNQLKEMGIHLSMDDFGTGYSSLSYLRRLPLDQIKIDRSFIRDITHDADDAAIVRAIIGMADILGIEALAEGVETTEQLDFLSFHGCRAYQGYYFSRPVAAAEFERLMLTPESTHRPRATAAAR